MPKFLTSNPTPRELLIFLGVIAAVCLLIMLNGRRKRRQMWAKHEAYMASFRQRWTAEDQAAVADELAWRENYERRVAEGDES